MDKLLLISLLGFGVFHVSPSFGLAGMGCVQDMGDDPCTFETEEFSTDITGAGGQKIGERINCRCRSGMSIVQCHVGCYMEEAYPRVSCISGYVQNGITCVSCSGCTNCISDADWVAHINPGYQRKATKTCSCNTCNTSTVYRCAAGYYGSSSNGVSGCTICPAGGTSDAGDNAVATKCYASPQSGSDASGNWEYVGKCYYTP